MQPLPTPSGSLARRALLIGLGASIGSLAASGCVQLTPRQTAAAEVGRRVLDDLKRRARTITDGPAPAFLAEAARLVMAPAPGGPAPQLLVLDGPWQGAFVLPGGATGVFTGLLEHLDRPAELAALLALYRAQLDSGAALARLAAAPQNPAAAFGLGGIDGSQSPFAQQTVAAAERLAVGTLAKAGYDPQVLGRMWERLAAPAAIGQTGLRSLALMAMQPGPEALAARAGALRALGYRS